MVLNIIGEGQNEMKKRSLVIVSLLLGLFLMGSMAIDAQASSKWHKGTPRFARKTWYSHNMKSKNANGAIHITKKSVTLSEVGWSKPYRAFYAFPQHGVTNVKYRVLGHHKYIFEGTGMMSAHQKISLIITKSRVRLLQYSGFPRNYTPKRPGKMISELKALQATTKKPKRTVWHKGLPKIIQNKYYRTKMLKYKVFEYWAHGDKKKNTLIVKRIQTGEWPVLKHAKYKKTGAVYTIRGVNSMANNSPLYRIPKYMTIKIKKAGSKHIKVWINDSDQNGHLRNHWVTFSQTKKFKKSMYRWL